MFCNLPDADAVPLSVIVDGEEMRVYSGETVAAVLLRQRSPISSTTPVHNSPRAPYCMMGVCFECLATINGKGSIQTCLTQVQEGMVIQRQFGRRSIKT